MADTIFEKNIIIIFKIYRQKKEHWNQMLLKMKLRKQALVDFMETKIIILEKKVY